MRAVYSSYKRCRMTRLLRAFARCKSCWFVRLLSHRVICPCVWLETVGCGNSFCHFRALLKRLWSLGPVTHRSQCLRQQTRMCPLLPHVRPLLRRPLYSPPGEKQQGRSCRQHTHREVEVRATTGARSSWGGRQMHVIGSLSLVGLGKRQPAARGHPPGCVSMKSSMRSAVEGLLAWASSDRCDRDHTRVQVPDIMRASMADVQAMLMSSWGELHSVLAHVGLLALSWIVLNDVWCVLYL